MRRVLSCVVLAALCALCACESLPSGELGPDAAPPTASTHVDKPPLHRRSGERLPAFSGGDPNARGWVKVDELLWLDSRDEEPYRRGFVSDGETYVSVDAASECDVAAECGFRLRTDHLAVYTNTSWKRALDVAREAEGHVTRLMAALGETLDLRLPEGPLKVVVTATRKEFEETLRCLVPDPVDWGAFYDARTGNVYVSLEPARCGPLPWRADLRHEMTHQILDLSRPPARRGRAFERPWYWLWEGIALWSEELGTPSGALPRRLERFRKQAAWGDSMPLHRLVALGPRGFTGPQYDQTASLMQFLLDPAEPNRRDRVLALVGTLLREQVAPSALDDATGMSLGELDRRWRATIGR